MTAPAVVTQAELWRESPLVVVSPIARLLPTGGNFDPSLVAPEPAAPSGGTSLSAYMARGIRNRSARYAIITSEPSPDEHRRLGWHPDRVGEPAEWIFCTRNPRRALAAAVACGWTTPATVLRETLAGGRTLRSLTLLREASATEPPAFAVSFQDVFDRSSNWEFQTLVRQLAAESQPRLWRGILDMAGDPSGHMHERNALNYLWLGEELQQAERAHPGLLATLLGVYASRRTAPPPLLLEAIAGQFSQRQPSTTRGAMGV